MFQKHSQRSIIWVETTLSADGQFQLPGKQALQDDKEITTVVVDVTEHPINCPKKQEEWYSGKTKRHTVKSQIIADTLSRLIYDVDAAPLPQQAAESSDANKTGLRHTQRRKSSVGLWNNSIVGEWRQSRHREDHAESTRW